MDGKTMAAQDGYNREKAISSASALLVQAERMISLPGASDVHHSANGLLVGLCNNNSLTTETSLRELRAHLAALTIGPVHSWGHRDLIHLAENAINTIADYLRTCADF
jgi:hypothetical protein